MRPKAGTIKLHWEANDCASLPLSSQPLTAFCCLACVRYRGAAKEMLGCVLQALKAVADRVPDILAMGVPIPEHIPFDTFNVFSDQREMDIYGKKKLNNFSLDMDLRKQRNPEEPEADDQTAPAPWEVTCLLLKTKPCTHTLRTCPDLAI